VNRSIFTLLILTLMFAASLMAQTGGTNPPVTTAFAVLTKSVESKSASVGQELILQTIKDVIVDGEMVIPRGSKFSIMAPTGSPSRNGHCQQRQKCETGVRNTSPVTNGAAPFG
jgi:hypothetical protein